MTVIHVLLHLMNGTIGFLIRLFLYTFFVFNTNCALSDMSGHVVTWPDILVPSEKKFFPLLTPPLFLALPQLCFWTLNY